MNAKILASLIGASTVAALAGGATVAYFSDTEKSTGNTFAAETLNLQVSDQDPLIDHFEVTDAQSGKSGVKVWALKNTGSVAGSLDVTFSNLVDDENTVWEPESGDNATSGELADALTLNVYIDEDNSGGFNTGDTLIYNDLATGLLTPDGDKLKNYAMPAGYGTDTLYPKNIRLEWSVSTANDNLLQSDKAGFDVEFELLQNAD